MQILESGDSRNTIYPRMVTIQRSKEANFKDPNIVCLSVMLCYVLFCSVLFPQINNEMTDLDASETTSIPVLSFSDFPEDVQLCILSFLTPSEISSFACTSKQFLAVCRNDSKLWFSMCDRRWGSKTQIKSWGSGMISYKHLYETLHEYENLIGFWRLSSSQSQAPARSPDAIPNQNQPPALVFFEWGPSFITGSRVSPSDTASYNVVKAPFLWMGISPKGEIVNFLEPNSQLKLDSNSIANDLISSLGNGNELVSVDVNHMGGSHIVIEERVGFNGMSTSSMNALESGSPPDRITSELYQYFANRTSPGGERAWRRQRQRRRERGNKKWDAQHFLKIVNYSPTTLRPLQGLWKGICEDANLDFYLVAYDDIGGIACRRVGDSCKPFSSYAPVFWTSNTTFFESPFSSEEEYIYDTRQHLLAPGDHLEKVSRILYINSSYDLVIPGLATVNPHEVEGRIWQYGDGTFGFGFLRDNHIIDLKHIAVDGCLLDATESL